MYPLAIMDALRESVLQMRGTAPAQIPDLCTVRSGWIAAVQDGANMKKIYARQEGHSLVFDRA